MDKHEWYLDQWLEPCVVNLLKLMRIDLHSTSCLVCHVSHLGLFFWRALLFLVSSFC